MIFCEQCGNQLGENAKFCGKCGTPVAARQAGAPPTGASGNGEDPASKAFNAGVASLQEERYAEAVKHFSEAIRHNPNEAEYYNGRGLSHSNLGSSDAAIADYSKAIQLCPNAEVYAFRGMEYIAKDDLANARADLKRGFEIDPNEESVVRLAEAIKEIDSEGGMAAPTACAQCGAPLEEGDVFCANCGAEVGAAAQYKPAPNENIGKKWVCPVCGYVHTGDQPPAQCPQCKAPAKKFVSVDKPASVQAQRQATGGQVLKEGLFARDHNYHLIEGTLILYNDRLEWKEVTGTIVNLFFDNVSSVKKTLGLCYLQIITANNEKYNFELRPRVVDWDGKYKKEVDSWVSAINSAIAALR
jgi:rubrerythrin